MRLERQFDVSQSTGVSSRVAARDDTLCNLFPDSSTEIVEREEKSRTTRTHYTVLGRPGVATFRFRKSRIRSAISCPCVSSAKCPVSSR